MKRIVVSVIVIILSMQMVLGFADSDMKLIIGGKEVPGFSLVGDSIYVSDEILAGSIGVGPSHCDCGTTDLVRGNRSVKFDSDGVATTSEGDKLPLSAIHKEGKILYPLRAVCEYFNYGVSWDDANRACTIIMKERLVTSVDRSYELILDVRSADEYAAGHIDKAINIPVGELQARLQEIDGYRDVDILVYCKAGKRSAQAVEILAGNGFTRIYNLYKGYDSLIN